MMNPATQPPGRNRSAAAALKAIDVEAAAIEGVRATAIEDLPPALEILDACRGKIIISGIGKSGHIGRKMAATFASVGRPSLFVHATEALHGDSGVVGPGDVVILISNSGRTSEVCSFALMLQEWGVPRIAFTQNPGSPLGSLCDVTVRLTVESEADPLNLAPTSSTTVTLVLGDALAAGLMEAAQFTADDFGARHPGGSLGARVGNHGKEGA